jgi:protein-S-isoprenylcysteine O-methyltransferase Ste14
MTTAYFVFHGRGTLAVFDPPAAFVPHGLNRFVRNPVYIGYVTGLLGLGLCFRSVSMLLFALVAFLLIHTFVVLVEEPGLRKRFGHEYEDYCRAVPRWIPRFTQRPLPT